MHFRKQITDMFSCISVYKFSKLKLKPTLNLKNQEQKLCFKNNPILILTTFFKKTFLKGHTCFEKVNFHSNLYHFQAYFKKFYGNPKY